MKKLPMMLSVLSMSIAILSGLWVALCAVLELSDECILFITAILLGAGSVACIASFFIPELPRLPHEQGRTKEAHGFWGLPILLAGVFLLVLDWENHTRGKELFLGQMTSTVAAVSVLTCFGVVCTTLAAQHCLCWNEDGFMFRTVMGRVHHYCWQDISARDSYRGAERIFVGKRCFVIPSPTWISDGKFWAYAFKRRKQLGLSPIPRKQHWPHGGNA